MTVRVKTGIKGFDKLVQGGLPKGMITLVVGVPGAGKTIFGTEFLVRGAEKNEPGIYVTFSEGTQTIREQGKQFGWKIADFEKKNKLKVVNIPVDKMNVDVFGLIEKEVKAIGAKRIVVDSLAELVINSSMYFLTLSGTNKDSLFEKSGMDNKMTFNSDVFGEKTNQQFVYLFLNKIRKLGVTSLFVTDTPENGDYLTRDTVSEFACDGVVQLHHMSVGSQEFRTLEIKKLRLTNQTKGIHKFSISKEGIVVSEESIGSYALK